MKETPIVLSISMLISGREEMKKSLDSLHYFTEAFPCEIILVDTGCNPQQRALAEQYADKIVNFTWCNDFSAARNAGLKEARGEWFMYLDDDEWFENPQQIVDFFVSGEYKNYKCASYAQRNYVDRQGIQYEDSYPSRMIKLTPKTRFFGKIHEFLDPFELPKKEFTDFVHHYGYVFEDKEALRKHTYRNIVPLLELRKEHPGEPRWMCQLAQEYFMLSDYEEIIRVSQEGLAEWDIWKEKDLIYAPSHVGALYAFILISLETLGRYDEEKVWLEKAFADPNMKLDFMEPTVAFYCMAGAKMYCRLGDYEKSREYFRRYIDYARRLRGNRELLEAGAALVVAGVFQEVLLYGTVLLCMEAAIRTEDHALAEDAFFMLDWQDWRLQKQNEYEKAMLDACCSTAYHPVWVKILQTLVSRPEGMKEMLVVFLETEIGYKQQGGAEAAGKLSRLRRLMAQLDYENRYLLYAKILWTEEDPEIASGEERDRKLSALFGELFEKYTDELLEVKGEIWSVAERRKLSLKRELAGLDHRRWKQMLDQWCRSAALWEIRQWEERLEIWRRTEEQTAGATAGAGEECAESAKYRAQFEFRLNLLAVKCVEGYLYNYQEACPGFEGLERMLFRYAGCVLQLYRPYYEEFVFDRMQEVLPDEARLALRLEELHRFREEGNERKALESARKCLGVCAGMEEIVGIYAQMYRDEMRRRDREAAEAKSELQELIAALKRMASQQLEKGNHQEAKEILLQVRQCAPGDEEVEEMLKKLENTQV